MANTNHLYRFNIARLAGFFYRKIYNPPVSGKTIFLTFDDGPHPDSTPELLDILAKNGIKATFFCLGKQVVQYPDLYENIKHHHLVGNHGYEHLNGFRISVAAFLENVAKAEKWIDSRLFRPPYGKVLPGQYRAIKDKYQLVLWTHMPGDFDEKVKEKELLKHLLDSIEPGAIVVLHDTPDTIGKLRFTLPAFIETAQKRGFAFKTIE